LKRRALERHLREHGAEAFEEGANHTKWRGPTGGRSVVPPQRNRLGHRYRDLQAARRPQAVQPALIAAPVD